MFRLYKRGKVWWARVKGQRRSTGCVDKTAAEAAAREFERCLADPSYRASNETTLSSALGDLVEELQRRGRSAATITVVKQKSRHLVRLLGGPLAKIDARAVDKYISTREAEGAHPLTITKELSALQQSLKLSLRHGTFHRPLESVMPVSYSPRYRPRTRWLPERELGLLLEALPTRRAAHVAFIVATAARWSESLSARREDVGAAVVALRGTKTVASRRTVPILPVMVPLLRLALDGAPGRTVLFDPWPNSRRDIRKACAKAGIDPCTANDFRRTAATWLRNAGVEPQLIGVFLGHTTSRMVELVYGRGDPMELGARIAERMGTVPDLYRPQPDPVRLARLMRQEIPGNLSRLRDLNSRPAVYETSREKPRIAAFRKAIRVHGDGPNVPDLYRRNGRRR